MEEKRLYSINVLAYALAKDKELLEELEAKIDPKEPNKVYFTLDSDIGCLIKEYKEDEFIQRFIVNYKHIKELIYITKRDMG